MTSNQQKLLEQLQAIGSIHLNAERPYRWASGWLSPIYCDNRRILAHPTLRTFVAQQLSESVQAHFGMPDALVGVATGGIAIGALAAHELGLPFGYVRSKPKDHGLTNQVEGQLPKGMSVVVVEDLVSTGGSSLQVVRVLREQGYSVLGMVAIFTYGFPIAEASFQRFNVKMHSLVTYPLLLQYLKERNALPEETLAILSRWRETPETWGIE